MNHSSLFERITGEDASRKNLPAEKAIPLSIANHISKMMATRQGAAMTLPGYGMPSLENPHLSTTDTLNVARKRIANVITRYEPRLHSVNITFTPNHSDPLALLFNISGKIKMAGHEKIIDFNAVFIRGKKVRVV